MNTIQLVVTLIVQIVELVLPKLASDATVKVVDNIIAILQNVMPDIIKAGGELAATVKNVIDALKGNDQITPEQWQALAAFEAQIDADFDSAAADEGFPPSGS